MYKITCKELTGENCEFVAEGDTKGAAKDIFYKHGAESPLHQEHYKSATDEEKTTFSLKLDEYLDKQ
jgi:hypothetical protein